MLFRIEEKKKFKFRFYFNAVASWFDFFLLRTGYLSSAKGTYTCDFPFSNNVPKGRSKHTTATRSKLPFLGSFTSAGVLVDKRPVKIVDNSSNIPRSNERKEGRLVEGGI